MTFDSDCSRHNHLQQQQQHLSSASLLPKFKTAYSDIEDKRKGRTLTFDIEKIDSCCISLTTEDCFCIVDDERICKGNSEIMRPRFNVKTTGWI
jgi:hypothetical protein